MHEKEKGGEEFVGAGEHKCMRESLESEQECARELGEGLGSTVFGPNRGAGAVSESSEEGLSLAFVVGVGSPASRKVKKVVRKGGKAGVSKGGAVLQGSKGAKRKECVVDDYNDEFDVRMGEADVMGKKLKFDDNVDGNVMSLTVAEVGINQPREGQ